MFLSVFDVFKIGIGPSSSHTMGPMTAAVRFMQMLRDDGKGGLAASLRVTLYGSLAFTGKGHATNRAVAIGLLGHTPANLDPDEAAQQLLDLQQTRTLRSDGLPPLAFDPSADIVFDYGPPLPGHANGLVFEAFGADASPCLTETFYSIGGGFVVTAGERDAPQANAAGELVACPYPFETAVSMLRMARESGLSIAAMKRANELVTRPQVELDEGIARIWLAMSGCIDRGLAMEGILPGGLSVKRRANNILKQLQGVSVVRTFGADGCLI